MSLVSQNAGHAIPFSSDFLYVQRNMVAPRPVPPLDLRAAIGRLQAKA